MKKTSTFDKVKALDGVGFRWHSNGTINDGELKYDFYKGDKLTPEQKSKLKSRFGESVRFFGSSPQYAPEIRHAIVGFLVGGKKKAKSNPRRKKYVRRNKGRKVYRRSRRQLRRRGRK